MLELAAHADLDIVCLQKTRLVDEGVKAAASAARVASWQFVPGPQTFGSRGKPTAGVAVEADGATDANANGLHARGPGPPDMAGANAGLGFRGSGFGLGFRG